MPVKELGVPVLPPTERRRGSWVAKWRTSRRKLLGWVSVPLFFFLGRWGGGLGSRGTVWDIRRDGILVSRGALVEVVRDAFVAGCVLEVPRLAGDGEERLEGFLVEVAVWVLGGFVGHHGGREGVAGWGDQDAGELGEEKVRVVFDGVVEAGLAEAEQGGVLLGCWLGGVSRRILRGRQQGGTNGVLEERVVILLELVDLEQVIVATVHVLASDKGLSDGAEADVR